MFELWRLAWEMRKVRRTYEKKSKRAMARKSLPGENPKGLPPGIFRFSIALDQGMKERRIEREMDFVVGTRLHHEARKFDIETPPITDREMWTNDEEKQREFYTPKGRAYVRKLVDAEKARRFEVKTLWVTKLIIPLVASLVGILGALTGLFAILHRKP